MEFGCLSFGMRKTVVVEWFEREREYEVEVELERKLVNNTLRYWYSLRVERGNRWKLLTEKYGPVQRQ